MSSVIPFCAYYGGVMNELRDLFGILLENAIEMIIIQDKNGIILYSNSGCNEELGYEQGLVNHRVVDVIPEELKDLFLNYFSEKEIEILSSFDRMPIAQARAVALGMIR